jgi:hypothetical protein
MSAPPQWPIARLRQFGGGAWIIAAALAVGGTFAPLFEEHNRAFNVVVTSWGLSSNVPGMDFFPDFGIPVVIAAAILVTGAVLALTSTRLHPASAAVLAARLLGTGATGVLIGCTATIYLVTTLFSQGNDPSTSLQIGLGMLLLIASALVAVVGTVLMLVPRVEQRLEPETPAMGIAVVRVLEPEFDEPAPEQKG